MKEINNPIEDNEHNTIKNSLFASNFQWYLSDGINSVKDGNKQFCHLFFAEHKIYSNFFDILKPVLNFLKATAIVRIKANLNPKINSIIEHGYHTDFKDCKTAVYYVNTNNGYTKFKNGFISKSEENKIICFDSNLEHTGTSCTDEDFRCVINFNYY
jgi:hypothetical protein